MPNAVIEQEPKKKAPKRATTKTMELKVRRKVKLYELPLPETLLTDADPDVELRVTLSYFTEPNKFGREKGSRAHHAWNAVPDGCLRRTPPQALRLCKPSSTERGTAVRRNSTSATPRRKLRAKLAPAPPWTKTHRPAEWLPAGGVGGAQPRRPAQAEPTRGCNPLPPEPKHRRTPLPRRGVVSHASTVAGRPGARAPARQPLRPPIRTEGAVPRRHRDRP